MQRNRAKRDLIAVLAFMLFGGAAVTAGLVAARDAEHRVLQLDAERDATTFVRSITSRLAALADAQDASADLVLARPIELPPEILRLRLHAGPGKPVLEIPLGSVVTAPGRQEMTQVKVGLSGKVAIATDEASTDRQVSLVAVPLTQGRRTLGVVTLWVDQTDVMKRLADAGALSSAVIAFVIIFALGAPTAVLLRRSREKRNAEDQLSFIASYDPLTSLPNRAHVTSLLREALTVSGARGTVLTGAVLSIDIDRFKAANDSYGLAIADMLLQSAANVLQRSARDGEAVARVGADEFVMLIAGCRDAEAAVARAAQICEAMAEPHLLEGRTISATVSIGVALYPTDGRDAAKVMRHADFALERVKSEGGNAPRLFDDELASSLRGRREIEQELRAALAGDLLHVHYQPQIDLASGSLRGFEALARWNHPTLGHVPPNRFITVAEETGLIVQLGEWILRRACADAATWPAPLKVAVNLSPAQFRNTVIAELVERVLAETGLPASRLELEITESLILDNERAIGELARLRTLGVAIALDDFGTGYSSLSYLIRFPFSKIKIDKSFVQNLHSDPQVAVIVNTIVGLGASLEVIITAEGVETPEQAASLRRFGCDEVQGYLYGKPQPLAEARRMIALAAARTEAKVA